MVDKLGLGPPSRLTNVVGFMMRTCACVHVVVLGTRQHFFLVESSKNNFLKKKIMFFLVGGGGGGVEGGGRGDMGVVIPPLRHT